MSSRAEHLLGLVAGGTSSRGRDVGVRSSAKLQSVWLERLMPDPKNPRGQPAEADVAAMMASIEKSGLLQPLRARWSAEADRWVLVLGHTRLEACKRLGWREVDVICYPAGVSEEQVAADQLAENMVRSSPNKLATAKALDDLRQAWGVTAKDLAARVGLHPGTVSRYLALLELPAEARASVTAGEVAMEEAVVRRPRAARGADRPVRFVYRGGRRRRVEVEGRPGDSVVELLEAALAEARGRGASEAA